MRPWWRLPRAEAVVALAVLMGFAVALASALLPLWGVLPVTAVLVVVQRRLVAALEGTDKPDAGEGGA